MGQQWIIHSGDLTIIFDSACGVIPKAVYVKNFSGEEELVIDGYNSSFSISDSSGRVLRPLLTGNPDISYPEAECTKVVLNKLCFTTLDGEIIPQLRGSFQYDFFADGTAFCTVFFLVASGEGEEFKDLKLSIALDCDRFDDVKWAFLHRLEHIDGAIIQALGPERYLARNLDKSSKEIAPVISFNNTRIGGEALYTEFFVEGGASLDGKRDQNETSVKWQNGSPIVTWNFQSKLTSKPKLGMQFRNRFGWVIKTPPRKRHLPPQVMYHYLDSNLHYPTLKELEAMKDSGCNILVMHENWRFDVQNGGLPFDEKNFVELIDAAHSMDIRVAVYIRGNEDSVTECACSWFDRYLKKDFDGLYIDYGSPTCHVTAADEKFPHGQVQFRKHYNLFRQLRERVGKDGLIFSHTGPSFSGVSLSLADGYVSGEGEKGLLIAGRLQHSYFSMSPLCCGTMWTAAFPEYASDKMVPFLASTGQFPHSALGCQVGSSSLTHPGEPGINDLAFRPLWKIWSMFSKEQDVYICNDFNSTGIFQADPNLGHYLMISNDLKRALYVVTSFSAEEQTWDVTPNWEKSGFSPESKTCYLLLPRVDSPGKEVPYQSNKLIVTLLPNSCAGFYFNLQETDFSNYRRPYHQPCSSGLEYLTEVQEQKELRLNPPTWDKVYFYAEILPPIAFGYEDSLMIDLYDNNSYLVKFQEDGKFCKLAEILTSEGNKLYAGESSQIIDLATLLPPGRHHLGIYATHCGEPFYSFFKAVLSDMKGNSCELLYRNDYEEDRSFLHFDVVIK